METAIYSGEHAREDWTPENEHTLTPLEEYIADHDSAGLRSVRGGNAGTLVAVPVEFGRPTGIRTQNQRIIGPMEVTATGATSRPVLRLVG